MQKFLSNGGLSKMLWIILVFIVGCVSVAVLAVEILKGETPNPFLMNIVTGIIVHVSTIGGSVNTSTQLESHAMNIKDNINATSSSNTAA